MRDLGKMSLKAAEQYMFFFSEQDIVCEIKDSFPVLYFLLGGGIGNNRRVNLMVKEEDYDRAKVLFDKEEQKHAKRVEELTPAANRAMAMIAIVVLVGVVVFYYLIRIK